MFYIPFAVHCHINIKLEINCLLLTANLILYHNNNNTWLFLDSTLTPISSVLLYVISYKQQQNTLEPYVMGRRKQQHLGHYNYVRQGSFFATTASDRSFATSYLSCRSFDWYCFHGDDKSRAAASRQQNGY